MGFCMPQIHGNNFFFLITKNVELDPCFRRAHLVKHPVQCLQDLENSVLRNHPGLTNLFLTSNIILLHKKI